MYRESVWPLSLFCCRHAFGTEGRAASLPIVIDVIAQLLSSEETNSLECGGSDTPSNMQWQSVQEAKIKDRTERNCRRE